MFKSSMLLIMLFLFSVITLAQVDDRIVVNKSDLPPDLVKELEGKKDIDKYAEYVGVGKEIGIAISEGLKAVVDEADHFSQTDVGLYTMVLIAWAIVGYDIIQILIGVPIFFIGLFILTRYYRKIYMQTRVVIEKEGFFLWGKRKYQVSAPLIEPEPWSTGMAFVFAILWTAICMLIIFI